MDTSNKNKEIVKEFITMVFHNHDLGNLDGIMRDDYIQHNADVPQGKKGFIEFFEKCFSAIPDFRYTLKKIVGDGDIVMTFSTTTGTHTGEWIGQPATGNKLHFDVVDIFRIQDGLIAEHWDVADTYLLFKQIGRI